MKRVLSVIGIGIFTFLGLLPVYSQQPADGENSYRLVAVNPRFLPEPDTISCNSGRGVLVAADPDLDGDGKAEVLITEYRDGGRVLVFEVAGDNKLEYVWGSKRINPGTFGSGSTPRSVSVGDFDNNGVPEIIFQIGDNPADSLRGMYFYEFTGNDNDYGSEPVHVLKFEEIDTLFANLNIGRSENPLTIEDVDGDGKNEMLFTPRSFGNLDAGNLYILEVESGTFAEGNAKIRVEYVFRDMAKAIAGGLDGYVPVATAVGDIDNDNLNEIAVLGWTNIQRGGGIGFLEVSGVDTYTPGSVVPVESAPSIFAVKAGIDIVDVNGQKGIIFAGGFGSDMGRVYVIDNVVSEAFISESDIHVIIDDVNITRWGVMAIGDQDHGTGTDGFDIYVSNVPEVIDIEYKGTGALSDPNSYVVHGRLGQFNLDEAYDKSDGLFNSLYTYPGMDIDKDGNRDLVAGYKGACGSDGDVLEGQLFTNNTYGIFVFEWGDSTQSIPVTLTTDVADRGFQIITPEDYHLEQNYPNPFNPTTNITFTLPLDKTISLKIYNSRGQLVRTLINNQLYPQGTHTIRWDATDDHGNPVASGVYVYKLIFGNFSKSKTMTLVR